MESTFLTEVKKFSPVKVKLINAKNYTQSGLRRQRNRKVGCIIAEVANWNRPVDQFTRNRCSFCFGSTIVLLSLAQRNFISGSHTDLPLWNQDFGLSPRKTIDKHRQSWSTDNLIIRLSLFVQVHWCPEQLSFLFPWLYLTGLDW